MARRSGPLQSRFGHRLLLSFMLCALFPVGVAALILQRAVSRELEQEASHRLHEGARTLGFTLLQRLQAFEYGLRATPSAALQPPVGSTASGPFLSVAASPPPDSDPRSRASGSARLRLSRTPAPRIFLKVPRSHDPDGRWVEAEIHPDSLWSVLDPSAFENDVGVVVLDQSGAVLFASEPGPVPTDLVQQLGQQTGATGEFEWTAAGEHFIASRWTLFLRAGFGSDSWTVILSRPRSSVTAPLAGFRRTFLPVWILSLLVALIMGIREIRRHIGPLRALEAGAKRVAGQDFTSRVDIASGDEFQQLASALNAMAEKLGNQFAELERSNHGLKEQIRVRELAEQALRETEGQLRQAQKMEAIGTLAGGVAHDFNNLLTVISSYTDLALASVSANDPLHQDLEEVAGAARRAAGLTRQLLTFSRKQVVDPRILDLNEVVRGSEKLLHRLIGAHIEFRVECGLPDAWVFADQGQLDQILMNLVVNARDAMPDGGTLTVRTTARRLENAVASGLSLPPGPYVTLTVEDTGVGMSESTQARIFEPFFTTKPPGQGTGLGLSTVYGIVKQSGGTIEVRSELGIGTRFTVYLRGVSPESGLTGRPAAQDIHHRGEGTILVVEDESAVRHLARRVLEKSGYTVLSAENGEDALQQSALHPGQIDLLLTDMIMPKLGGKRLASTLEATRPGMRTLYMSGYFDQPSQLPDILANPSALLQKPFQADQLLQAVRDVLAGAPASIAMAADSSGVPGGGA